MNHGQKHVHEDGSSNLSRFSVENPHITWVLLIGTLIWGVFGYLGMPQRKDPDIPIKMALVETHWPGASAERVEELVTKNIEKVIASNAKISKIESTSRSNVSIVIFAVNDQLKDVSQVLDDIALRNGSYPQRYGNRTGAELEFRLREGTREHLRAHAMTSLIDASDLIRALRRVKSPAEIEMHRRAAALSAQPALHALSATERRVLALIAEYKTSKEIAEELHIHYRTVDNHRTNISNKLGLQGSHALLKFAVEHQAELI